MVFDSTDEFSPDFMNIISDSELIFIANSLLRGVLEHWKHPCRYAPVLSRAYRERGHATVNHSRRIAKYLLLLKLEVTPINY